MSECDIGISLDGIEHSLWDARIECPYCRIANLEQQLAELREAHIRNLKEYKHIDLIRSNHFCPWRVRFEAVIERSRAALEEIYED